MVSHPLLLSSNVPTWRISHSATVLSRRALSMAQASPHGYTPRWASGRRPFGLPIPSKVLCVAKNFAASKEELNSHRTNLPASMDKAIIFSKSFTSLVPITQPIHLQQRTDVYYETELALLITKQLLRSPPGCPPQDCLPSVGGIAIALDLTLKDVQNSCKTAGGSWETAKAFDRSCPVSDWVEVDGLSEDSHWEISTTIDDQLVQQQSTTDMLVPIGHLLSQLTKSFTLLPGDIILTGTPVLPLGPGPLKPNMLLELSIQPSIGTVTTRTS